MIETLKRYAIPIALFSLVPISSCTLIAEVDRDLINENPPDASGGTAGSAGSGGSGGSGGTDGSGGTAGSGGTGGTTDAPDDSPTSNDAALESTEDTAD